MSSGKTSPKRKGRHSLPSTSSSSHSAKDDSQFKELSVKSHYMKIKQNKRSKRADEIKVRYLHIGFCYGIIVKN